MAPTRLATVLAALIVCSVPICTMAQTGCGVLDSTGDEHGSPAGTPCWFPFVYLGVEYTSCHPPVPGSAAWCATSDWTQDGTHTWGRCNASCTVQRSNIALENAADTSDGNSESNTQYYIIGGAIAGMIALATVVVAAVLKYHRPQHIRKPPSAPDNFDAGIDVGGALGTVPRISNQSGHMYDIAQNIGASQIIIQGDDECSEHMYDLAKRQKTGESDGATEYAEHTCNNDDLNDLYPLAVSGDVDDNTEIKPDDEQEPNEPLPSVSVGLETVPEEDMNLESVAEHHIVSSRLTVAPSVDTVEKDKNNLKTLHPVSPSKAQKETSNTRRVNEQARGELAGAQTRISADSVEIRTNLDAQQEVDKFRRVNEQARGELVGQKTAFGTDAAELKNYAAQQHEISLASHLKKKNEHVGKQTGFGSDSKEMSTMVAAQKVSSVMVNTTNTAGDLSGKSTTYDLNSVELGNIRKAQKQTSEHLVVQQMKKTDQSAYDHKSVEIESYKRAQQQASANLVEQGMEQKGAKAGFDHNSEEMRNYKRNQRQAFEAKREKAGMTGHVSRDTVADAGYHDSSSGNEYIEVATLSPEAKARFETMMSPKSLGKPEAVNRPKKKIHKIEAAGSVPSLSGSTSSGSAPTTRSAQL